MHTILASAIVRLTSATGMFVSGYVPPVGWNCRHAPQLIMLGVWLLSAIIDSILSLLFPLHTSRDRGSERENDPSWLFGLTLAKDIISTLLTSAAIILTQWGVLSRCDCYTNWGRVGLALPFMPEVDRILRERLSGRYIAITFIGIAIQVIFIPLVVVGRYRKAVRVYIQRDDSQSNLPEWMRRLSRLFVARADRVEDPKVIRSNTLEVELGDLHPTASGVSICKATQAQHQELSTTHVEDEELLGSQTSHVAEGIVKPGKDSGVSGQQPRRRNIRSTDDFYGVDEETLLLRSRSTV